MGQAASVAVTTLVMFATTNVDTFALAALITLRDGRSVRRVVTIGQFLAAVTLVVGSLAIAAGAVDLPYYFFRYLGVIPLALGIRALYRLVRAVHVPNALPDRLTGISAYLAFLSNGGDNLAVYSAGFHYLGWPRDLASSGLLLVLGVVLTSIACAAPTRLPVARIGPKIGEILTPLALVAIGVGLLVGGVPVS